MTERIYVAISIKHSPHNKKPVLWGNRCTSDNEKRCFAGYTTDINQCELYSLEDFQFWCGNGVIKCDEPVKMCFDYCKRYKKYDTVLVLADELQSFLSFL